MTPPAMTPPAMTPPAMTPPAADPINPATGSVAVDDDATLGADPGHDSPAHPSDLLLQLIVAFLAPMFMSASTGDLGFARLAALETIASYGLRTQAELMNIAQIIAFGLAAMDSLWLSMADDVSLTMKIRLRSTANGLNRSAQQNQRVLDKRRTDDPPSKPDIAAPFMTATESVA